jgi:flagellar assembly factor FliW
MEIVSRFGPIQIDADQMLEFPAGLLGLEDCRRWALLADQQSGCVAWLQSVDRPEVALPVASPRRFIPGYQIRVARRDMAPLGLADLRSAKVLAIIGRTSRGLSLNLKAPVVINLESRVGRQLITNGELPIHYELESQTSTAKRIA